jgi:hypothetical protein
MIIGSQEALRVDSALPAGLDWVAIRIYTPISSVGGLNSHPLHTQL